MLRIQVAGTGGVGSAAEVGRGGSPLRQIARLAGRSSATEKAFSASRASRDGIGLLLAAAKTARKKDCKLPARSNRTAA